MSGGAWSYRQWALAEKANELYRITNTVAVVEHDIDWAVCGDTGILEGVIDVFDRFVALFDELYSTDDAHGSPAANYFAASSDEQILRDVKYWRESQKRRGIGA